jgi:hypothetical protein
MKQHVIWWIIVHEGEKGASSEGRSPHNRLVTTTEESNNVIEGKFRTSGHPDLKIGIIRMRKKNRAGLIFTREIHFEKSTLTQSGSSSLLASL